MNCTCDKIQILEYEQYSQIDCNIQGQDRFGGLLIIPALFDPQRQQIIHADGEDHDKDELWFSPRIEEEAADQEPVVAQLFWQQEIDAICNWEKDKKKLYTGKKHCFDCSLFQGFALKGLSQPEIPVDSGVTGRYGILPSGKMSGFSNEYM